MRLPPMEWPIVGLPQVVFHRGFHECLMNRRKKNRPNLDRFVCLSVCLVLVGNEFVQSFPSFRLFGFNFRRHCAAVAGASQFRR